MTSVSFHGVSKRYGDVVALDGLNLAIASGEFVSLLGPSGSGKTTTLNLLAGLIDADEGRIAIGERDVTALPPERRDLAMVFQNYALYPHMTVFENIAFPLQARRPRVDRREIEERVRRVAGLLGVDALLHRYPKELSGGQQQRVALGRAMVRDPKVFLLDEPLSNLDARLRIRMRYDLKALHAKIGSTIVYVTHDQAEAMTLSSRIAVFSAGCLQQFDTPDAIYNRPANLFVMSFVGDRESNFIDGTLEVSNGRAVLARNGLVVPLAVPPEATRHGRAVRLGIRPEAIRPTADGLPALVLLTELSGAEMYFYARVGEDIELVGRCDPRDGLSAGSAVHLACAPDALHLFDPESGLAISHGAKVMHP